MSEWHSVMEARYTWQWLGHDSVEPHTSTPLYCHTLICHSWNWVVSKNNPSAAIRDTLWQIVSPTCTALVVGLPRFTEPPSVSSLSIRLILFCLSSILSTPICPSFPLLITLSISPSFHLADSEEGNWEGRWEGRKIQGVTIKKLKAKGIQLRDGSLQGFLGWKAKRYATGFVHHFQSFLASCCSLFISCLTVPVTMATDCSVIAAK